MKSSICGLLSATALVVGIAALTPGNDVRAGIAQSPLTLAGAVKPNIALVIDNSGSMDGELLLTTNDGALWWNTSNASFWGSGRRGGSGFNYNEVGGADATWQKYVYLFPNGTGTGNRVYNDSTNDHFAVPPLPEYAFARSPDYNGAYYNPNAVYRPWTSGGGYAFADAVPTAAKSDPVYGTGTLNLTANVDSAASNWTFRVQIGMRASASGNARRSASAINQGFSYYPATYYLRNSDSGIDYSLAAKSYNCATPNPAAYAAFTADPTVTLPAAIHAIAPDGYCLTRYRIDAGTAAMQNFANWFQYHRKRHLALRAGMGAAFADISGAYVGGTPINGLVNLSMWDIDSQRSDLYKFVYQVGANSGGTPNRQALDFVGKQFNNSSLGIVKKECQKNFALQFTDGFSAPDSGNAAGDLDKDGHSNTIADIAMKYYAGVRSDLPQGKVRAPAACGTASAPNPNPPAGLDCNFNPHMNTYGITLGAKGDIFGMTHFKVADAYTAPPAWVDPTAVRSPVQVDDLYHAAVNGRGEMLNATTTTDLTTKLQQALSNIMSNSVGSGSRTAASSTRAGGGTQLFQARFNAAQWTGELIAYSVTSAGALGTPNWNAGTSMPAHATRKIYFSSASGARTEFLWDNLSAEQKAAFNLDPQDTTKSDGAGERRVRWLRGDLAAQQASGGIKLRDRSTALGDIVNSSPRYVGTENYAYDRLPATAAGRDSYQAFRFGKSARTPMVYVGANDGMLHAFNAATGIEQWAFIPSEFLRAATGQAPALAQLPRSDYAHRYYVDGKPVAGDAYFGGAWHTVLVTAMGAGGKSVIAIDVTDPVASTAPKVLWEFTDPDLGVVTGLPSIQRMANGKFAAIFGSGYGLDKSAKLFVVDIETGVLLAKIDTDPSFVAGSNTANGLSAPYPVDTNGDTIIDMIYAGDLWGNLWRFDVDNSAPGAWAVHHRQGNAPRPLITACAGGDAASIYGCANRQPITARPVVGRGPAGAGQMVYFGTGKFFEDGDNTASGTGPVQSFYGVLDDNNASNTPLAGRSALLAQSVLLETTLPNATKVRVTSNRSLTNEKGWYLDLVYAANGFKGERAVADPILQGGRIIFATMMPGDPCTGGSDGWLMELQARDGGRFASPVLDLNGDGLFTDSASGKPGDTVTHDGAQTAASGIGSTVGGLETPNIFNLPGTGKQSKLLAGHSGGIQQVGEKDSVARGRTSWRQIWP